MDEIEVEDIARLLDKLITSKNAEVKSALQELLVVVALAEAPANVTGPLEMLVQRVGQMEKELESLRYLTRGNAPIGTGTNIEPPSWQYPQYPQYPRPTIGNPYLSPNTIWADSTFTSSMDATTALSGGYSIRTDDDDASSV